MWQVSFSSGQVKMQAREIFKVKVWKKKPKLSSRKGDSDFYIDRNLITHFYSALTVYLVFVVSTPERKYQHI